MLFPEKFFHFREKYDISGKFLGINGKMFSYLRKNVVYPENFSGMSGKFFGDDFPPVANISGKKFLDALFYSKSAPQSLAPPNF
jgi:hypothetical protein